MERENRLSAGMTGDKVNRMYAVLKKAFEDRRRKLKEAEDKEREDAGNGER